MCTVFGKARGECWNLWKWNQRQLNPLLGGRGFLDQIIWIRRTSRQCGQHLLAAAQVRGRGRRKLGSWPRWPPSHCKSFSPAVLFAVTSSSFRCRLRPAFLQGSSRSSGLDWDCWDISLVSSLTEQLLDPEPLQCEKALIGLPGLHPVSQPKQSPLNACIHSIGSVPSEPPCDC